jgi:para-nitrobenzyl esterase
MDGHATMLTRRQNAPIARTALGALSGLWQDGIAVFRGVPYAAPPVGERRLAPAASHAPWSAVRDATRHGPIAPQTPSRLRVAMGDFTRPQDEDCLTLTIWTPALDGARRPVLVWLHGGAYTTGAASLDWYDGSVLCREGDIVVVGVNYRLGALGFLHCPGVSDGNLGIDDQQAALIWVRDHIASFGGDPTCVTVCGQSAGGGSIAHLLVNPAARGLFRRAILQSAPLGEPPAAAQRAAQNGERFLGLLGLAAAPNALTHLRALPATEILAAQRQLILSAAKPGAGHLPFAPMLAEAMTQAAYLDAIADGAAGKEVLIGGTREEMHGFFAADQTMTSLGGDRLVDLVTAATGDTSAIEPYRRRRPQGTPMDWYADLLTDRRFLRPSWLLAAAIAKRGGKAWSYRFDWSPPRSSFMACHCIEIPFVFGNWATQWPEAAMLAGGNDQQMDELSTRMRRCWIEFVRNGDPNHHAIPAWPAHQPGTDRLLSFDAAIRVDDWE